HIVEVGTLVTPLSLNFWMWLLSRRGVVISGAHPPRPPPPPWGGGGGGGGRTARIFVHAPSLALPRKRGREHTECAARFKRRRTRFKCMLPPPGASDAAG